MSKSKPKSSGKKFVFTLKELNLETIHDNYQIFLDKTSKIIDNPTQTTKLSDLNSKVPVSIEPNSVQSILTGTGEKFGRLQYTQLDNIILNEGDQIYSSGSGGIFKSGIPIGKINLIDESNESYVKFHSDFTQLRLVKIVLYENVN